MRISEILSEQPMTPGAASIGGPTTAKTPTAASKPTSPSSSQTTPGLIPSNKIAEPTPADLINQYKLGAKFTHPTLGQVTVKKASPNQVTMFSDKLNTEVNFDLAALQKLTTDSGLSS
jgi:hypothetical protein